MKSKGSVGREEEGVVEVEVGGAEWAICLARVRDFLGRGGVVVNGLLCGGWGWDWDWKGGRRKGRRRGGGGAVVMVRGEKVSNRVRVLWEALLAIGG